MHNQLDDHLFTCCRCKGEFSHMDGTWLPIDEEPAGIVVKEAPAVNITFLSIAMLWPPEVITSEDFTCYDCIE